LALQGFEGTGETVNSRGLHALSSFKHLQTVPWILAANYPVAEAYAPIKRAQNFFLAAIFIGALLSMVLAWMLMQRLTRPLLVFTEHVEKMAEKTGAERFFHYEKEDEIGTLARTFNQMVMEVEKQTEDLRYLGNHDALTGLFNRHYFEAELERLARGRQTPVSIIMADLDGLKQVNDRFGHAAGDDLIRAAAEVLSTTFRADDIVARIGGDEFAVLLPGTGRPEVEEALVRIRSRLVEQHDQGHEVSLALGAATAVQPTHLVDTLRAADERMYEDKNARSHG
jgi:diguanylate cyclase (GGDEF)-like protein